MGPTQADIDALLDAFNKGRAAEAERRAVEMTHAYPHAGLGWRALGIVLAQQGRTHEALVAMQKTAEFFPDSAETHNNLGAVLQRLDNFAQAEIHFRRATALKPAYAEAHNNLGSALMKQGRLTDAEAGFVRAIALNPSYADAHNNLGILLRDMCRLDEAEASFRTAVTLDPGNAKAHQNLIFAMDCVACDAAALQAERKRWAARFAPTTRDAAPLANSPDRHRRLRVGYVSADFKFHSATIFFGAMLTAFTRDEFEVFAYSNSSVADSLTTRFQHAVSCWRPIAGLSDHAVEAQIRADAIDILVDLSGHTFGNRLRVFAKRPAPILITAWGYFTGTGLDAIDVIFSDPVLIPDNEKALYAERQVRYLPNAISAFWPRDLPDVGALPAASTGTLTFGSMNRLNKASDETFSAWARVLHAVPGSRFLMKTPELDDPFVRERTFRKLTDAGVEPDRISLLGKTTWLEHMLTLNKVDIALDPFPQSGGVTTLENLAMGVPVVTLAWPSIGGRVSATILTALGMTDWIASTPEEYAEIALRKAANLRELGDLRRDLRARVNASVIGRQDAYVVAVEREYRALWTEWCEEQSAP